jgi:DNA-binding winged helix-turn-helix (wHTH) protein/tetratricopeptide (TPR) repeat protein
LNAGEQVNRTIRFGDFEIDTAALELRRAAEPVPLTPQAVRALIALVRGAGGLVTREELYAELWPEPDVDVDRGLNTLIRQIRIALGDNASDPTFIRTYPRRGYRFLVDPVRHAASPDASVGAAVSTSPANRDGGGRPANARPGLRPPRHAVAVLAAAGLVSVLLIARLAFRSGPEVGTRIEGDPVESALAGAGLDRDVRERFLEGRYLLEQGSLERRAAAVAPMEAVTRAAPSFAPGHAFLADALFWAGRLEEARAAAGEALDLDRTQVRALIVRGTVRLVRDWDIAAADADLREAVRLAGGEPEPHHALAFLLAAAGRHAEAVRELETAHGLDPISAIVTGDLGLIHLYAGDPVRAAEFCERAVSLDQQAGWAAECAFDALMELGRHALARPHAARMVGWTGESAAAVLGDEGVIDHAANLRFVAWRADRAMRSLESGGSAWSAALALAGAGRRDDAIHALLRAARERGPGMVTITIDPRFRALWSEPTFRDLAARLAERGFAPLPS